MTKRERAFVLFIAGSAGMAAKSPSAASYVMLVMFQIVGLYMILFGKKS